MFKIIHSLIVNQYCHSLVKLKMRYLQNSKLLMNEMNEWGSAALEHVGGLVVVGGKLMHAE